MFKQKRVVEGYRREIRELKDKLADLKKEKEIEETTIKHFVKMKEERQDVELQKRELEIKEKYQDKEATMMKKYYESTIDMLDNFKSEILRRLPDISMVVGGKKK